MLDDRERRRKVTLLLSRLGKVKNRWYPRKWNKGIKRKHSFKGQKIQTFLNTKIHQRE